MAFLSNISTNILNPTYSFIIPSFYLVGGGIYTFRAELRNFLGTGAVRTATIRMRPATCPELTVLIQVAQNYTIQTISTDGYLITIPTYRRNSTFFQFDASILASCGGQANATSFDFLYNIIQIDPFSDVLNSNSIAQILYNQFMIGAYSLTAGNVYTFKIIATLKSNSLINASQIIAISVQHDQLFAKISVDRTAFWATENILLYGSNYSYDGNILI